MISQNGTATKKSKARKNTKARAAAQQIRASILSGEIRPGDWLRQDELSEQLTVSATPLREAFAYLEAEGLVEHIPHHGVRVVTYSMDSVQEYYDLRALLESYAIQLAAERIQKDHVAKLKATMREAQTALHKKDIAQLTELNWRFHQELLAMCGSRLVQEVVTRVWRSFQLDNLVLIPERATASFAEHKEILDALMRGDGKEASERMQSHITTVHSAMQNRLPKLQRYRE